MSLSWKSRAHNEMIEREMPSIMSEFSSVFINELKIKRGDSPATVNEKLRFGDKLIAMLQSVRRGFDTLRDKLKSLLCSFGDIFRRLLDFL